MHSTSFNPKLKRLLCLILFMLFLLLAACDTGTDGNPNPNPNPDIPLTAVEAATTITQGTTPEAVVQATKQVLAQGGIMVGEENAPEIKAVAPAASWFVDPVLAFNMATEAHQRKTSGRFTVTQVAQMWADMGFPFNGTGTPGEQLMGFLRAWVKDAKANPSAVGSFTPLFIAEMAKKQEPAIDLGNSNASPDDLRLSMLEIELMMAAFDRSVQVTESAQQISTQAVGACDELKKALGPIGEKIAKTGLSWAQGIITDESLKSLGMTEAEVKTFTATTGKIFKALDFAMKIVKMIQIYASSEITLTVDETSAVHKPHKDEARVLVPVTARAGIPDQAWQDYQKANGGEAYQNVTSCLSFLGMPLPSDLKDIASKVDKWKVSFSVVRGLPKHVLVPSDVNDFNASFSGHPFTMKLVRDGDTSAKATLKVDVKEESELATIFQGPVVKAPVKVKAEVYTAESPSPTLLLKTTSLLGTISALLDLSVGWIQTGFPPSNTITFEVAYHDLPTSLEASASIDMHFRYSHLRTESATYEHTAKGTWSATLNYDSFTLTNGVELDGYTGEGNLSYQSATTEQIYYEPSESCRNTFTEAVIDGTVSWYVGPAFSQQGNYLPDKVAGLRIGNNDANAMPKEQKTIFIDCPPPFDDSSLVAPASPNIMVGALVALGMMDGDFIEGGDVPGISMDNWVKLSDGTLERRFDTGKTVSIILNSGIAFDTDVLSQNNILRLKPIFAPQ